MAPLLSSYHRANLIQIMVKLMQVIYLYLEWEDFLLTTPLLKTLIPGIQLFQHN
jgi:hypothetical protein